MAYSIERKLNNISIGSEIQILPAFSTLGKFSGSMRYEGLYNGRIKYSYQAGLNNRKHTSACLGGLKDIRQVPVIDVYIKLSIQNDENLN